MSCLPSSRQRPSLWARFAAFLSFLAVLSALVAPVSMLAQEVRTGKLGGICTVNAVFQGGAAAFDAGSEGNDGSGGSSLGHAASHCALCGALGLAMPPLLVVAIGSFAGTQVVGFALPTPGAAAIPGLPFSRGPPAL